MDKDLAASAILRHLKREMNGAVVGAMQKRGIVYPVSYGVSLPTIRSIAEGYAPDHRLAMELYATGIRELMLAALFIDDPAEVTPEQMRLWGDSFTNPEIVENCASALFWKAPEAVAMAKEWMSSANIYLCYGGLLMAARAVRRRGELSQPSRLSQEEVDNIIRSAEEVVAREDFDTMLSHGVVTLLGACAGYSDISKLLIRKLIDLFSAPAAAWANPALVRHTAGELNHFV